MAAKKKLSKKAVIHRINLDEIMNEMRQSHVGLSFEDEQLFRRMFVRWALGE